MRTPRNIFLSIIAISAALSFGNFRVEAAGGAFLDATEASAATALNEIPFHKGVNINAWFDRSTSKVTHGKIKGSELDNLKRLGMDVVRLPINFHSNVGEGPDFKLDETYLEYLDKAVERITSRGLWVILDHHSMSVEDFPSYGEELITSCCSQLALRYKGNDRVMLEIYNEPFSNYLKNNWSDMQGRIIKAVRGCNSDMIMIVTGWGGKLENLQALPDYNDSRLIYTFHYYEPYIFTHQGAYWDENTVKLSDYPFPYDEARMPEIHPDWAKEPYFTYLYDSYTEMATVEKIHQDIKAIADWANKSGKPVFCGEFGALNTSGPADRYRWYKAVADALNDNNIPWTLWQYNDNLPVNFSIFKDGKNYSTLDTELMAALGVTVPDDFSPDALYLIGDGVPSGWEASTPMTKIGKGIYQYSGVLKVGNFNIFTDDPRDTDDWKSNIIGLESAQTIDYNGVSDSRINLYATAPNGDCYYKVKQTGYYNVVVDLVNNTISTEIGRMYINGVPTDWNFVAMESEGDRVFSYKGSFDKAGQSFGFLLMPEWNNAYKISTNIGKDYEFGLGDYTEKLEYGSGFSIKNAKPGHYVLRVDLKNLTFSTTTYNPDPIEALYVKCGEAYNQMDRQNDGKYTWTGSLNGDFVITPDKKEYPCYMPLADTEYVSDTGLADSKMLFNTASSNDVNNKWRADNPAGKYTVNVDPSAMTVNVDVKISSGVEQVSVSDDTSPVEYYDLFGRKVLNPGSGVYIRVHKGVASKIIL